MRRNVLACGCEIHCVARPLGRAAVRVSSSMSTGSIVQQLDIDRKQDVRKSDQAQHDAGSWNGPVDRVIGVIQPHS